MVMKMKYKAITLQLLKISGPLSGMGLILMFILINVVPFFWHVMILGRDWPWACGMMGFVLGITLPSYGFGLGFQLGVPRKVMSRAMGSALAVTAAIMATGAMLLQGLFNVLTNTSAHWLTDRPLWAVWGYLGLLAVVFGFVGLLVALLFMLPKSKHGRLGLGILVVFGYLVGVIAVAMVFYLLSQALPSVQTLGHYVTAHLWATDTALLIVAVLVSLLAKWLYSRMNVPQGGQA